MSRIDKDGYRLIYNSKHPLARKNHYVLEHRLIAYERLGVRFENGEVIHHKNGNRLDNRPENLEVCTRAEHITEKHGALERLKPTRFKKGQVAWNKGKLLKERTPEYIAERKRKAVEVCRRWRAKHQEEYKRRYLEYQRRKALERKLSD